MSPMCAAFLAIFILPCLIKSTNYETPHYVIFSIILLFFRNRAFNLFVSIQPKLCLKGSVEGLKQHIIHLIVQGSRLSLSGAQQSRIFHVMMDIKQISETS